MPPTLYFFKKCILKHLKKKPGDQFPFWTAYEGPALPNIKIRKKTSDNFCILKSRVYKSFLKDLCGSYVSSHCSSVIGFDFTLRNFQFPSKLSKCYSAYKRIILCVVKEPSVGNLTSSWITGLLRSIFPKHLWEEWSPHRCSIQSSKQRINDHVPESWYSLTSLPSIWPIIKLLENPGQTVSVS